MPARISSAPYNQKSVISCLLLFPAGIADVVARPGSGSCQPPHAAPSGARSEEHTSELQSRENLVCRLLLEKKNHEFCCRIRLENLDDEDVYKRNTGYYPTRNQS